MTSQSQGHNPEEVVEIQKFVRMSGPTIFELVDFIKEKFGVKWSTTDEQTVRYLNKLIETSNKKRKLLNNN